MPPTAHDVVEPEVFLRELVCFNFYRGWRGISEHYRKYLPHGISAQQSYIMEICEPEKGVLVSHIAHILEIDISAISGMLRRMEKASLIRREIPPENRRQTLVYLTEEGAALREKVRVTMIEADEVLRATIPQPMIKELIKLVDKIRDLG